MTDYLTHLFVDNCIYLRAQQPNSETYNFEKHENLQLMEKSRVRDL